MTPTGIPWNDGFNWDVANYAPLTVGGALILFGGWWLISAKNWFKGPVRMGTEDELEQMEAQAGGGLRRSRRHVVRATRRRQSHVGEGAVRAPSPQSLPHPGAAVLVDRLTGDAARVR